MTATYEQLIALDDRLVAHGIPPFSDWWRERLGVWYRHPSALTLAACCGRGAAKSTALYKVALAETLHGAWVIPPGERHWASLTSRLRDEAGKGAEIIAAWLRLLGVRHSLTDGVIELADLPRGIRISACSVAGNTGWRTFFNGADEVAKWPSEGALAVDAGEILASKRAMTTTHARARHMVVSTPFLDSGPFHAIIVAGSSEHTIVAGPAPTWVVAPHVTLEHTLRLEPNASTHAREYGSEFATSLTTGFFAGLIESCIVDEEDEDDGPLAETRYAMAIDPAFASDQFAIAVAHHEEAGVVVVDLVEVVETEDDEFPLTPTSALERTKEIANEYGVGVVMSDQFAFHALHDLAERVGLYLHEEPWTASNKAPLFEYVRTMMRDGKLVIPNDPDLHRELSGIATKLLPSGHEQITARPGFRDDRVHAMVMAIAKAARLAPRVRTPGEGSAYSHVPAVFVDAYGARHVGSRYHLRGGERDPFDGLPSHVTEVTTTGADGTRETHSRGGGRGIW